MEGSWSLSWWLPSVLQSPQPVIMGGLPVVRWGGVVKGQLLINTLVRLFLGWCVCVFVRSLRLVPLYLPAEEEEEEGLEEASSS